MLTRRQFLPAATAAAGLTATIGFSLPARAEDGPQETVNHALGTLQDLRGDKEFGNALTLMHRARAVLIAPRIFKAGFFVGGEGGSAVLLARHRDGRWSSPAFFTIASASFGLQIGAQLSELIMFVMSERALDALLRNKFQIGANAGIAVATLGSTVAGATTTNGGPDIVVWASSSGAYAGVSLDGTLVQPQGDADAAYYGRAVTTREVIYGEVPTNPGALPLIHSINRL